MIPQEHTYGNITNHHVLVSIMLLLMRLGLTLTQHPAAGATDAAVRYEVLVFKLGGNVPSSGMCVLSHKVLMLRRAEL